MDTQPPEDPSALVQKIAELQAQLAEVKRLWDTISVSIVELERLLAKSSSREDYSLNFPHNRNKIRPVKKKTNKSGRDMNAIMPLDLRTNRQYFVYHCFVCDRDWVGGGKEPKKGEEANPPTLCNYPDCRAATWDDPIAAQSIRRKRKQRRARRHQARSQSR